MPLLREVKGILSNTTLFDMSDSGCTNKKFKLNFKRFFFRISSFERVVNLLEECRIFLLEEFTKRFTDVDASILWSSLLDPRFASATYLSGPEKYKAKYLLKNEVLYLVMQDWVAEPEGEIFHTGIDINSDDSDEDNDVDFILKLTGSRISKATNYDKSPETRRQEQMERENIAVKHEVEAYIRDASAGAGGKDLDPLLWWKEKRDNYPRVSLAARKWLSVCSTSTPSERVFQSVVLSI